MYPSETTTAAAAQPLVAITEKEWSTGLWDCFSNCERCCLTLWCPCITFGQIAEIVDEGSSSCGTSGSLFALIAAVFGTAFVYSCSYRTKLRRIYNVRGDWRKDCLAHAFCMPCAMTQEYRELTHHGFDVPLGWHENTRRRAGKTVAETAPVVPGGMYR